MSTLDHWPTGRLLSAAARLVEHSWNAHLSRWDLNHAGIGALHVLQAGPMTQRELATAVQVEEQTISRTLERLGRQGYVERRRDEHDRRRILVSLTETGREVLAAATDRSQLEGLLDEHLTDPGRFRSELIAIITRASRQRWPGEDCHATMDPTAAAPDPPQEPEVR